MQIHDPLSHTPVVITETGPHITRGGEVVVITEIRDGRAYGHYESGIADHWSVSGRVLGFYVSDNDII